MNSEPSPSPSRRAALRALIAGSPLAVSGCLTVEDLDNVQADWDRKYPEGTGIQGSKLPKMIQVLATYEATKTQRAAAEQRARQALQRMARQKSRQVTPSSKPKSATTKAATIVSVSNPTKPLAVTNSAAATQKKASQLAQTHGTVAVLPKVISPSVPGDNRKEGKETVMLWSTASQELVGNQVYDLGEKPRTGTVALWGGQTSEYVGN